MDVKRIGYTQKTIGGAGCFMVILQSPQGLFLDFLDYAHFFWGGVSSNEQQKPIEFPPEKWPNPQGDFGLKIMDKNQQTFRSGTIQMEESS